MKYIQSIKSLLPESSASCLCCGISQTGCEGDLNNLTEQIAVQIASSTPAFINRCLFLFYLAM